MTADGTVALTDGSVRGGNERQGHKACTPICGKSFTGQVSALGLW